MDPRETLEARCALLPPMQDVEAELMRRQAMTMAQAVALALHGVTVEMLPRRRSARRSGKRVPGRR